MVDKRPDTIMAMFDRIAPTYDRINTILSLSLDQCWRKAAVKGLDITDGETILDIATGTGLLALQALKATQCTVVGIDFSRVMLAQAASKVGDFRRTGRYRLLRADALSLPFPDVSFQKAMVAFGIRNIESIERLLDEAHRVLCPQGRLAVLEFSVPPNPLLRLVYLVYFTRITPLIGGCISGDHGAYRYLRDSVMGFHNPDTLAHLMKSRGFSLIQSSPLFFGITHLYVLEREQ